MISTIEPSQKRTQTLEAKSICLMQGTNRKSLQKELTSNLKENSKVVWSVSHSGQSGQDIAEIANLFIQMPQVMQLALSISDDLERFNWLARTIKQIHRYSQEEEKAYMLTLSSTELARYTSIKKFIAESSEFEEQKLMEELAKLADTFIPEARKEAALWLEAKTHQDAITRLEKSGKHFKIVRWSNFREEKSFEKTQQDVYKSYSSKAKIKRGIEGEISNRIKALYDSIDGHARRLISLVCRQYLLEEAAARVVAGFIFNYEYECYFGTVSRSVIDIYHDLGNPQMMKVVPIKNRPMPEERSLVSANNNQLIGVNPLGSFHPTTSSSFLMQTFRAVDSLPTAQDSITLFSASSNLNQPFKGNMLQFFKQNHRWKIECLISYADKPSVSIIKTLIENIAKAKESYIKEKAGIVYPKIVQMSYGSQDGRGDCFHVSASIRIDDQCVIQEIDPFDILINYLVSEGREYQAKLKFERSYLNDILRDFDLCKNDIATFILGYWQNEEEMNETWASKNSPA